MPGLTPINPEGTGIIAVEGVIIPSIVDFQYNPIDEKYISVGRPGGQRGKYEKLIDYAEEFVVTWDQMDMELWAQLRGGDLTTPAGATGAFEEKRTAVAGVFPALTNIPVRTNLEFCWRLDTDGSLLPCKRVVGAPADPSEYNIIYATGVISTSVAYAGDYYVSYGADAAAGGFKWTADPTDIVPSVKLQIATRCHSLMEGKEGVIVITYAAAGMKKGPGFGASREGNPPNFGATFSVGGQWIIEGKLA